MIHVSCVSYERPYAFTDGRTCSIRTPTTHLDQSARHVEFDKPCHRRLGDIQCPLRCQSLASLYQTTPSYLVRLARHSLFIHGDLPIRLSTKTDRLLGHVYHHLCGCQGGRYLRIQVYREHDLCGFGSLPNIICGAAWLQEIGQDASQSIGGRERAVAGNDGWEVENTFDK